MVRVRGPSLAQGAAGALGKVLIFSQSKGRAYVKKWARPSNPNSQQQEAMRACTQFFSQNWNLFPYSEQKSWNQPAEPQNIPAYNCCLQYNLDRIRRNLTPTAFYPGDLSGTNPTEYAHTATQQGRQAKWLMGVTDPADLLCYMIYFQAGYTCARAWYKLVRLQPVPGAGELIYYHGPLQPGPYTFGTARILRHGKDVGAYSIRNVTIV